MITLKVQTILFHWLICVSLFLVTVYRIHWCIDLFSCIPARVFNKLTYLLTYLLISAKSNIHMCCYSTHNHNTMWTMCTRSNVVQQFVMYNCRAFSFHSHCSSLLCCWQYAPFYPEECDCLGRSLTIVLLRAITKSRLFITYFGKICLQCFATVGWALGEGQKNAKWHPINHKGFLGDFRATLVNLEAGCWNGWLWVGLWVRKFPLDNFRKFILIFPEIC